MSNDEAVNDSDINLISIREFRKQGFLQEVNRQFFHPLGLALAINGENCPVCDGLDTDCERCDGDGLDPDKEETLYGIWDYRDDPEGILFSWPVWQENFTEVREKAFNVMAERGRHFAERKRIFDDMYPGIQRDEPDIEPYLWQPKEA